MESDVCLVRNSINYATKNFKTISQIISFLWFSMSGVLAGSLWTSVIKPDKFLSGASGGVYALITAHLGTVIMNYRYLLINYSNKYIKIFDKKFFFFSVEKCHYGPFEY